MCQTNADLKSLGELFEKGYTFVIPPYQRGYRWDEEQVNDLLDDIFKYNIRNFAEVKGLTQRQIEEHNKDIFQDKDYCLQPIVVKKIEDKKYELIDGQQRLTTLLLIALKFKDEKCYELDNKWYKIEYNYDEKNYRENTANFINHLMTYGFNEHNKFDIADIDSFYIKKACKTIDDWNKNNIITTKAKEKWIQHFKYNYRDYVKIIWYETKETNPIAVFRRLNTGKIRLEDAELIKALFLKEMEDDKNYTEKKKFRIASEWDYIEKNLQDDGFWHFLSRDTKKKDNRIDLIFNLIREQDENYLNTEDKALTRKTFRYFWTLIQEPQQEQENASSEEKSIQEKLWEDIVIPIFYTLKSWYNDKKLYHLVGFLINTDKNIKDIYKIFNCSRDKTDFINELKQEIYNSFLVKKDGTEIDIEKDIKYNPDPDGEKVNIDKIKPILLLHNILTCINNPEATYKFPFDIYLKNSWDIEHISPAHTSQGIDQNKQKEWYDEHKDYIKTIKDQDNVIENAIEAWKNQDPNINFNEHIFAPIVNYFNQLEGNLKWSLANLALLKSETNRSYGNALFPKKREEIIEKDMKSDFVPICTKNAFLGYYPYDENLDEDEVAEQDVNDDTQEEKKKSTSKYDSNIYFWTKEKAKGYLQDIKNMIDAFCADIERQKI